MDAKQRQDQGKGRGTREDIGWIKRLFTAWRVSHAERTERRAERKEAGEDTSGNPVVSCNDAPEGDPSASISRGGTSVRRESGPEQRYDLGLGGK